MICQSGSFGPRRATAPARDSARSCYRTYDATVHHCYRTGEGEVVQELPPSLRLQLALVLNKRLFEKLPLFKDVSELAMVYIVQKMVAIRTPR